MAMGALSVYPQRSVSWSREQVEKSKDVEWQMRGTSRAFLLFEHFKMLFHCLLGHVVSSKKFVVILILVLYIMYLLLLYFLFIIDFK